METETVKTVENIKAFLPLTLMEGKRSLLHLESSGEAKEYVALCSINKKHEKLAEFLYKAANSHYELLQCLKNCLAVKPHKVSVEAMKDMIRAALEKATS